MIWTKRAHQSAKLQTFNCSRKISPNLYFGRLLKVYKILAKKHRGVISHDPEDWCKIWRKSDLLFQKWQEFGEIWPEHSQVSKTCTFICSCCAEYLMFKVFKVFNQGIKEKKAFRIPFITKKQLKSGQALLRISLIPQYKVYKGSSILCFNGSFSDVSSFSKISQPPV